MSDPRDRAQDSYLQRAWNSLPDVPGIDVEATLRETTRTAANIRNSITSTFNNAADMARPFLRQLWNDPMSVLPNFSFSTFANAFAQPFREIYEGSAAETRLNNGGRSISRRLNEFEGWVQNHASLFNPAQLMTDSGAFSAIFGVKRFLEGGAANHAWDPGGATAPGGVTRNGHPEAYRQIMSYLRAGEFDKMENYLHDFYKRTYWDRLDQVLQLPEGFQFHTLGAKMFAFDIALNHGLNTARSIVQGSGGDLKEMIEARYEHFSRQNNPGVVGQFNRVTIAGAIGEMTNAIVGGQQQSLPQQALNAFTAMFSR